MFPDRNGNFKQGWETIGTRLKDAMSDAEYAQARRTTQYAHYTGENVIRPIYAALERMGFAGGRILEPGMGIGLFNGLMPSGMAANSRYTGVEYDTMTGRISAIDMRFVDPSLPSDPKSKLNQVITDVIEAYRATADRQYSTDGKADPLKGSSLLLFSDIGLGEQSAKSRGFDMRGWIEQRFDAAGIPREHYAFIRDYKAHAKKERLFADMREGKKRIMIGGKDMETGVNVQKRLVWLGHIDAPWFPSSIEQREGRGIRQGNQNAEIDINAYATKGSYDSTMWGMNARKARFIEQALNGDDSVRSLEDVSEASAFEVAAALASGDERYLKLAGLKSDVERLERPAAAHHNEQRKLKSSRYALEEQNERDAKFVDEISAAIAKRKTIKAGEFEGKVRGAVHQTRETFSNALFKAFADLSGKSRDGSETIGEIGGFPLMFHGEDLIGKYRASVSLDLPGNHEAILSYPFDTDMAIAGIATRAANQINGLDRSLERAKERIEANGAKIEQINKRIGAPFAEQADLIEKHAEYVALQSELTTEATQPDGAEAAAATVEIDASPAIAKEGDEQPGEKKYSIAPHPDKIPTRMENLARGKEALAQLLASRDPVSAPQWHAMHRNGLGWISFVWETGPHGELGIGHLIEGRADQGKNAAYGNTRLTGSALTDFVKETIPAIIIDGRLGRWYQVGGYVRRNLYGGKGTVVLQPVIEMTDGTVRVNFVATAFPGAGKEMPVAAALMSDAEAVKRIEKMVTDAKGRGSRPYSVATQARPSADGIPTPRVGPSAALTGSDLGRAGSSNGGNIVGQARTGKINAELAADPLGSVVRKLRDAGKVRIVETAPNGTSAGAQGWTDSYGTITLVAGANRAAAGCSTMAGDRVSCCVPFCRRTRKNPHGWTEWICGGHWRAIPKERRRVWSRFARMMSRAFESNPLMREPWKFPGGSPERIAAVRMRRMHDRLWSALKRIAIERAGGI